MNRTPAFASNFAATALAPALTAQPRSIGSEANRGASGSRHKAAFTGYDVLALAALVAQTWSLIRVPLIPIAISSVLSIALVVLAPRNFINGLSVFVRVPFLAALAVIFLLQAAGNSFLDLPFYYAAAATARQFIGASAIVSFLGYMITNPARPGRFLTLLLVLLGISQIWYFCELRMPDRFIPLRAQLYADIYLEESYEKSISALTIARGVRSGLTPRPHGLGYVSCGALAYSALSLLLAARGRRTLATVLLLVLAGLSLATLYYSLQRSAVLGAVAGLGLLYLGPFKTTLSTRLPFILLLLAISAGSIIPAAVSEFTKPPADIVTKTMAAQDYGFRIGLQLQALSLTLQCPLGLAASGKNWNEHGFLPVAERYDLTGVKPLAPHNGYLGVLISYGWVGVGLVITFLASTATTILRVVRQPADTPGFSAKTAAVVAASAFGLVFIQSMFHNASVMNREPVSTAFVTMLGYLAVYRLRERSRPCAGSLQAY
jgi:hypothetical protein